MTPNDVASGSVDGLVLDLLEWLCHQARSYEETIDAWRTSCPRLPVWEEANDRGLIVTERTGGRLQVRVTPAGFRYLRELRPERASQGRV
jgi:hypothetical protein